MIKLYYFDISKLNSREASLYLEFLPLFFKKDIYRYKFVQDRNLRVIARLMLLSSLQETESLHFLNTWTLDQNGKPFIAGWKHFNISHSGNYVVLAIGDNLLGVDIEFQAEIPSDIMDFSEYLHPAERAVIEEMENKTEAFYTIWVKKEAFTKALGCGILTDLKSFNCSKSQIYFQKRMWWFYKICLNQSYISFICSSESRQELSIIEFCPASYVFNQNKIRSNA